MPLRSMTGFARSAGETHGASWSWELRSVNGRGLDIRLRLPAGFEALEQTSRAAFQLAFARGNCQAGLTVKRDGGDTRYRLNEQALREAHEAAERARKIVGGDPIRVDTLMQVRGVLETTDSSGDDWVRELDSTLRRGLQDAISEMESARASEGQRLQAVLEAHLATIEALVASIRTSPARTPEAVRVRLTEQVAALADGAHALTPERLHQEAVLLAAKADIEEELNRLDSHIEAARVLFSEDAPVGRKLEFLTQELNREANTICSKSNDIGITRAGLELKAVIDQLREQVQNIE